jgi:hypothetical protein
LVKQVPPKGAKTDFEQEVTEDTKKGRCCGTLRPTEIAGRRTLVKQVPPKGAKTDFEQEVTEIKARHSRNQSDW